MSATASVSGPAPDAPDAPESGAPTGVTASVGSPAPSGVVMARLEYTSDVAYKVQVSFALAIVAFVLIIIILIVLILLIVVLAQRGSTDKSHVYLSQDTAQVIATATPTAVSFDTIDHRSNFKTVVLPVTTITPKKKGRYIVSYQVAFGSSATGIRSAYLYKNGTTQHATLTLDSATAGFTTLSSSETIIFDGCNDSLQLVVEQTSGGNLSIGQIPGVTQLHIDYLGLFK